MSNTVYGIDLGTTNSLIGCNGKLISSLVSSKVNMREMDIVPHYEVGDNIIGSYKIDMGLSGPSAIQAVRASSIVLRRLVKEVYDKTGDTVKDVVISVPAYFSSNQRTAVRMAAEQAGLNLITVVNEPTAAAIRICGMDNTGNFKRGVFVVYDLGGGTFDCTAIDSRSGTYHVLGTDGCILGGDDLDAAIRDRVLTLCKVPVMKQAGLPMATLLERCKEWKFDMQQNYSNGNFDYEAAIELPDDMDSPLTKTLSCTLTMRNYQDLVKEVFEKTAFITKNLIDRKIPSGVKYNLVYVGGSTHCDFLISYINEQIGIDWEDAMFTREPDFVVAEGVVRYATALQNGGKDVEFKDVTKQLSISDKDGKAIVIIKANTNIPCQEKKIVTNSEDTQVLHVRLYQGNSLLSSENEYIGYLEYDYGVKMPANSGDVEVTISVDSGGFITLEVEDIINFGEKISTRLRGF